MKSLTAIVLAAGAGRRFWPLTDKVFFPLFGKPLVANVLDSLPKEVSRIVVVSSPQRADAFRALAGSQVGNITVVVQEQPTGMADALLSAQAAIGETELLVVNADDVVEDSLGAEIYSRAKKSDVFGIIPAWRPRNYFHGGYLRVSADRLIEVVEKPNPTALPGDTVTPVIHYFRSSGILFAGLKAVSSRADDRYEVALSALAASHDIRTVAYDGPFASLKFPWHVLDVMQVFFRQQSSHRGKNVHIAKNVQIDGPVWIGDRVKIFENTKIVGPCFIGNDTIVGNSTIIRESHIGDGCVTGFNTDITRSYVGDSCWFHSNYIGDSVLESNVSMGSGTVLANLRLDDGEISSVVGAGKRPTGRTKLGSIIGRNVRIGVNVSVMPGIKIGANAAIGAGVLVDRDVESGNFVIAKQTHKITKNAHPASSDRSAFRKKLTT